MKLTDYDSFPEEPFYFALKTKNTKGCYLNFYENELHLIPKFIKLNNLKPISQERTKVSCNDQSFKHRKQTIERKLMKALYGKT